MARVALKGGTRTISQEQSARCLCGKRGMVPWGTLTEERTCACDGTGGAEDGALGECRTRIRSTLSRSKRVGLYAAEQR